MPAFRHCVDRYSLFHGVLRVRGWIHADDVAVRALTLEMPSGRRHPIDVGLPSPDVAAAVSPTARHARFDATLSVGETPLDAAAAVLHVTFADGEETSIERVGVPVGDPVHELFAGFGERLRVQASGRLLEVGSRARSGIVRRDVAPEGWEYSGLDVMAGPNVDVVGDAHRLSSIFPCDHFDAVMSVSVLEHLLMPWKFVIELNRVLRMGAIGVITTHQTWPLHDEPWDFWRFSDRAWVGLLNAATGFEILEAKLGEPAYVVAEKLHPPTAFAETPAAALSSGVLFRKIATTTLDWPVELADLTTTRYPTATSG